MAERSNTCVTTIRNTVPGSQDLTVDHERKAGDVPVVGIGASAGGLDAFRQFFTVMPSTSGIAFVLIQHLAPDHESMMAELLGRYTAMPVVEVEDRMPIQPNYVYLIPPNKYLDRIGKFIFWPSEIPITQG